MEFGPTPLDQAQGATLAHTIRLADGSVLRKSHKLTAADVERLRSAGADNPVTVRLGPDDVEENAAAEEIAALLRGGGVRLEEATAGRCNLVAEADGLASIGIESLNRLNRLGEDGQVATVRPWSVVRRGALVATVKVVPFAVSLEHLRRVREADVGASVAVEPFRSLRTRVIVTRLAGTTDRASSLARERVEARVLALGGDLLPSVDCAHHREALADELRKALEDKAELVLVFAASATVDRRDVVPTALEVAGGHVERLGMPVDPGNLLLLGSLGGVPVVGVPGCARSPAESGFDVVLARLMARLDVASEDLANMGVGGLLREPTDRPEPRRRTPVEGPTIGGVVLAAGFSKRMGDANKLLADVDGQAMVRRVVATALESRLDPVVVVTGHDATGVREALEGLPVVFAENPDPQEGLSSSLKVGIGSLPTGLPAAVVLLGDMPWVPVQVIEALRRGFDPAEARTICVPVHGRRRGNPVLWSSRYFGEMMALRGDRGAKSLLAEHPAEVLEVSVEAPGVLRDVDTLEELRRWTRGPPSSGPGDRLEGRDGPDPT